MIALTASGAWPPCKCRHAVAGMLCVCKHTYLAAPLCAIEQGSVTSEIYLMSTVMNRSWCLSRKAGAEWKAQPDSTRTEPTDCRIGPTESTRVPSIVQGTCVRPPPFSVNPVLLNFLKNFLLSAVLAFLRPSAGTELRSSRRGDKGDGAAGCLQAPCLCSWVRARVSVRRT